METGERLDHVYTCFEGYYFNQNWILYLMTKVDNSKYPEKVKK